MQNIKLWLANHPMTVNIVVICVAVVLIVALVVGVDLSWVPPLLTRLLGM